MLCQYDEIVVEQWKNKCIRSNNQRIICVNFFSQAHLEKNCPIFFYKPYIFM